MQPRHRADAAEPGHPVGWGVYISFPFCTQKCTYCNFASGVFSKALAAKYLAALAAEIEAEQWSDPPGTLYLGGGTPSLIEPEALARILRLLPGAPSHECPAPPSPAGAYWKEAGWKEAAIEAAPGTVTRERAAQWRVLGLNRVSLGVQSFVSREIAATGRKHSAAVVAEEVDVLRGEGISNINIDLIAGLPHQTFQSWRESLDWIERLAPPHVSVYMLEADEDSRLGREILHGGARFGAGAVPEEDEIAEFYLEAVERLERSGIRRYEVSNFARPGFESAHNLKYWRLEPYRGFGADAHSFDGCRRWSNVETAGQYVERHEAGASPVDHVETVDDKQAMEEHFFVGLRQAAGIEPLEEEWRRFGEPIRRLREDGLLEREGGRLRLSGRGVMLSNEVFQEFLGL